MVVDAAKVQDSGLLKDVILLDVPDEKGAMETVLVKRATGKIRESSAAWTAYSKEQGIETVRLIILTSYTSATSRTIIEAGTRHGSESRDVSRVRFATRWPGQNRLFALTPDCDAIARLRSAILPFLHEPNRLVILPTQAWGEADGVCDFAGAFFVGAAAGAGGGGGQGDGAPREDPKWSSSPRLLRLLRR